MCYLKAKMCLSNANADKMFKEQNINVYKRNTYLEDSLCINADY